MCKNKEKEYIVELHEPFHYYIESYLYSKNVYVVDAKDGATTIKIKTEIAEADIRKECSVDIKRVIKAV